RKETTSQCRSPSACDVAPLRSESKYAQDSVHRRHRRPHQWRATTTPQGYRPTLIERTTLSLSTSITDTSLEAPLVVNSSFWSGVKASCQTRWPTRRYFSTLKVAVSMTATRLAGPSATNACLALRLMRTPTGWIASALTPGISKVILARIWRVLASITVTLPPISALIQTCDPSGVNSATRARLAARTVATIVWLAVSLKCAMLVVSDVATSSLPSGLMPSPSGSTPTGISATTEFLSM